MRHNKPGSRVHHFQQQALVVCCYWCSLVDKTSAASSRRRLVVVELSVDFQMIVPASQRSSLRAETSARRQSCALTHCGGGGSACAALLFSSQSPLGLAAELSFSERLAIELCASAPTHAALLPPPPLPAQRKSAQAHRGVNAER